MDVRCFGTNQLYCMEAMVKHYVLTPITQFFLGGMVPKLFCNSALHVWYKCMQNMVRLHLRPIAYVLQVYARFGKTTFDAYCVCHTRWCRTWKDHFWYLFRICDTSVCNIWFTLRMSYKVMQDMGRLALKPKQTCQSW